MEQRTTQLKLSEERFRDFSETGSDWYWELDENLRYIFLSPSIEHESRYPVADYLGKARSDVKPDGIDDAIWHQHLDDLQAHRPFRNLVQPRTMSDGVRLWISASGKPIFDEAGQFKGYRGTGTDITAQKEIEGALEEAQRIAAVGSWRWSVEHDRMISCSDEYLSIYGLSRDVAERYNAQQFALSIHPDDLERVSAVFREVDQVGRNHEVKYRIIHPNGEVRHVYEIGESVSGTDGPVTERVGITRDITEQVLVVAELEKSHTIQNAILDNIAEGVSMSDADGRIIAYNQQFLEINDFPSKLLEGDITYEGLVRFNVEGGFYGVGDSDTLVAERLESIYSAETSISERAYADGRITQVRRQLLPSGGIVVTDRDITEQKSIEEQLQKAHDNLELQVQERTRKLLENEATMAAAVKLARLGYSTWDSVDDKCTYCSEEYAALHGVSVAEYMANAAAMTESYGYNHPDDEDTYKAAVRALRDGKGFELEYRVILPSGEIRWIHEIAEPVFGPDGTVIEEKTVAHDITEQKNAEAVLIDSEQRYMEAARIANVGHWAYDEVTQTLVYCSEELSQIYGVSQDDLETMFLKLGNEVKNVHPDDREEFEETQAVGKQGGIRTDMKYRIVRPDGSVRYIHDITERVHDDTGRPVLARGTVQDITDQMRVEAELRAAHDGLELRVEERTRELHENEALLSHAARIARVGHWVWDEIEGRSTFQSALLADIYGNTVEEHNEAVASLSGVLDRIHADDLSAYNETLRKSAEAKTGYEVEVRVAVPDGGYVHVRELGEPVLDDDGNHIQTVGVTMDITEQKRNEEILRRQNLVTEEAERAANFGHWMWDEVNGAILHCSRGLARLRGATVDECMADLSNVGNAQRYVHPDDLEATDVAWVKMQTTGEQYLVDYRFIRPDGETRWFRDIGSPMAVSDTGKILTSVGITYDITDSIKLDEMKNEFISTVSQELRTPITSIKGALGLARSGNFGEISKDVHHLLEIAHNNSERTTLLIDDILDMDKIISESMILKIAPVDVGSLVNEAVHMNRGYGDEFNVTFVSEPPDEAVIVDGDKNRLMQVLSNLMSNAAKFSRSGENIEILITRPGNEACVSVKDKGCGIPEEHWDSIFDKFTQVDGSDTRQVRGSGLGLSISKAIMDKHGGTIGFESEMDVGSTFFFTLPISS